MDQYLQHRIRLGLRSAEKQTTIPSILIATGVFLGFFNNIKPSPWNLFLEVLCAIGCLFIAGIHWNKQNKDQFGYLITIVFVAWAFNVVSVTVQGGFNPLRLVTLAYMLYSVLVSFVMVKKNIALWPLKLVFYIIAAYFIYELLILETNPLEIFYSSAGGMMNTILISIAIPVQLFEYRRNAKISIIPPIVVFIVSTYSLSRTSMACAALYFLAITGVFSFRTTSKKAFGYILFAVILIILTRSIINNWDNIMAMEMYEKFDRKGIESSGRTDIWNYYFQSIDLFYFLFGRNVDQTQMIYGFANTHNSFIQLHSQLGILAIAFIVYFIRVVYYYIRNNFITFLLLLVLIIRCFYDTPYFFGIFDYSVFVLLLDYNQQTQSISQDHKLSWTLL